MTTCATFNTLPDDIILHIISTIIDHYHFSDYATIQAARRQKAKATAVVAASQLCQSWRYAALGCRSIWGRILTIDTSSPVWIDTLLERSGNTAPLYIYSNPIISTVPQIRQDFASPVWTALFERVAQWKILDLTVLITKSIIFCTEHPRHADADALLPNCKDVFVMVPLIAALSKPAPMLEIFKLYFQGRNVRNAILRRRRLVPDSLFSGVTPRLSRFNFCDVLVNTLSSLRMSKILTHLNIKPSDGFTKSFSTSQWLDILDGQTKLVSLRLEGNVMTHNAEGESHLREVELPSLRVLQINLGRDIEANAVLFANLVVPTTCEAKVHLTFERHGSAAFKPMPLGYLETGFKRLIANWCALEGNFIYSWTVLRTPAVFGLTVLRHHFDEAEERPIFKLFYRFHERPRYPATDFVEMVVNNVPESMVKKTKRVAMDVASCIDAEETAAFNRFFSTLTLSNSTPIGEITPTQTSTWNQLLG